MRDPLTPEQARKVVALAYHCAIDLADDPFGPIGAVIKIFPECKKMALDLLTKDHPEYDKCKFTATFLAYSVVDYGEYLKLLEMIPLEGG